MKIRRGRRLYSVLIFIALASGIFLCFQLFSAKVLDLHGQDSSELARNKKHAEEIIVPHKDRIDGRERKNGGNIPLDVPEKNCLIEECNAHEQKNYDAKGKNLHVKTNNKALKKDEMDYIVRQAILKNKYLDISKTHSERETLWGYLEATYSKKFILKDDNEQSIPRGVFFKWSSLYKQDDTGMFTCIQSKEKIPIAHVNDDYCDCADHSDEPGTSACVGSRFYCSFQLSQGILQWVPASGVNDGLCDCCDGSDEWDSPSLPEHVNLHDGEKHGKLWQSPCKDHCAELRAQEERLRAMRAEGSRIKASYIEAAKGTDNKNQYYGPRGAFYKLSLDCFEARGDKYTYKLCPFSKAEQTWSHAPGTVIGRQSTWISMGGEGGYQLVMEGGDSSGCPDHGSRETIVHFECGVKDALRSISETERCTYTMYFSTPAAC